VSLLPHSRPNPRKTIKDPVHAAKQMTGGYLAQHGIRSVYPGTELEKGRQTDLKVARKVFSCRAGSQAEYSQHNISALELQVAKKRVHFQPQVACIRKHSKCTAE